MILGMVDFIIHGMVDMEIFIAPIIMVMEVTTLIMALTITTTIDAIIATTTMEDAIHQIQTDVVV